MSDERTIAPTYFVGHPDGSFTPAQPQPAQGFDVLAILELLDVRRVVIGTTGRGLIVSRERFAELLAPHFRGVTP